MSKKRVVDIVADIVTPFLEEADMELVDVEFVKEGQFRYLRVYIDKDGGVSLDDCQHLSRHLNERLDKLDPIEENYFLEVSSPGVERTLKKDSDFEKYKGHKVMAKLYKPLNGEKIIEGILNGLGDNRVYVAREDEVVEIPRDMIALIKLVVDFD